MKGSGGWSARHTTPMLRFYSPQRLFIVTTLVTLNALLMLAGYVLLMSLVDNEDEPVLTPAPAATDAGSGAITGLRSFRFDLRLRSEGAATMAADDPEAFALVAGTEDVFTAMAMYTALTGEEVSLRGAYEGPNRLWLVMQFDGAPPAEYLQLRWDVWRGPQPWQLVESGFAWDGFEFLLVLGEVYTAEYFAGPSAGAEDVNGVLAERYHLDLAQIEAARSAAGQDQADENLREASLDLWRNSDGVLVRWRLVATGVEASGKLTTTTLEMTLSDIEDPAIDVPDP